LIPDTSAVKPKASQSTDGHLLWSVVYISDTACLHAGTANNTPRARITAAALIQGARADIHSHRYYCWCPLTVSEDSKVSFELLVKALSLAIGLWVISCQGCEFNYQYVIEFTSELSNELRASIQKDCPRESMELPDFSIDN
jgi:hypothetical protein